MWGIICDSQCKNEALEIPGRFLPLHTRPVTLKSHEIFRLLIDVSTTITIFVVKVLFYCIKRGTC